jgi:Histidine kinase
VLQELNHRISNEFQSVMNLVSLTAARSRSREVKAALGGVTKLLHRYADVHRALQIPMNGPNAMSALRPFDSQLRTLVGGASRSCQQRPSCRRYESVTPERTQNGRAARILGYICYGSIHSCHVTCGKIAERHPGAE